MPAFDGIGIIEAIAVPHPPLIVPTVGRGEEAKIQNTIDAYHEAARRAASANPDVLILTSPHAPLFRDGFFVSDAEEVQGTLAQFRAPQTKVNLPGDPQLAHQIAEVAEMNDIPIALESQLDTRIGGMGQEGIDHGAFVPLYFLAQELPDIPVVRIGLSALDAQDHQKIGRIIADITNEQGKRAVFVASGDLSHKLLVEGPYGFDPAGPIFNEQIGQIFTTGDLEQLFSMDKEMCDNAAECGLRSFQIMTGALLEQLHLNETDAALCNKSEEDGRSETSEKCELRSELLSNEGPFGVGYAVAIFTPEVSNSRSTSARPITLDSSLYEADDTGEHIDFAGLLAEADADPFVALARQSVESFVRTGRSIELPEGLPLEMLEQRAGAFVSLHENGDLRGCIGTIAATQDCIADEIIMNGISACSRDPRFPPVQSHELDYLEYSVDILDDAEPISSAAELDPKRYGVIVTKGWKRGLLLPNLDGVDTVDQQLSIAKQKAGIDPSDNNVQLERFEVIRHTRGGEARR